MNSEELIKKVQEHDKGEGAYINQLNTSEEDLYQALVWGDIFDIKPNYFKVL